MPPLIGALIVGAILIAFGATAGSVTPTGAWFGGPQPVLPAFSWQAMLELVVPLAITVLVVQNGQGVAVLHAAGHEAPINRITLACGLWSMLTAVVGTSVGLGMGTFLGWGLVRALATQEGFLTFQLPITTLAVVVVLSVVAGVLAAVRPAHRAARLDVLDAIAER